MRRHRRSSSAGAESTLVIIVLAAIAMPILAVVLLLGDSEEGKDWGIFFAVVSVLVWVPVVFTMMFN